MVACRRIQEPVRGAALLKLCSAAGGSAISRSWREGCCLRLQDRLGCRRSANGVSSETPRQSCELAQPGRRGERLSVIFSGRRGEAVEGSSRCSRDSLPSGALDTQTDGQTDRQTFLLSDTHIHPLPSRPSLAYPSIDNPVSLQHHHRRRHHDTAQQP